MLTLAEKGIKELLLIQQAARESIDKRNT
jgi:hypothetical protein